MEELLAKVKATSQAIAVLKEERTRLIKEGEEVLLNAILNKMDWQRQDVSSYRIEYSDFDRRIMADIRLINDRNARFVFAIGLNEIKLQFREEFSC